MSFTLYLVLGVIFGSWVSFSYSEVCIDRWLRQDAYWLEELPDNNYTWPEILFADYTSFEDTLCAENKYSLIVRPDADGYKRALDAFWYTRDDYLEDPESITRKVENHMKFEYSNCGYTQLMPTNASIAEFFSGYDFLLRHSQAPQDGDFVDFYKNFDENNSWINSLWRYMLVDMAWQIVKWWDNFTEIEEEIFLPYCRDYNCNWSPEKELDVDNDQWDNNSLDEEDIDGDTLLDIDHRLEFDTDGDGIINALDLDIDCDGIWNGSLDENDMDGDWENDEEDEDEDGDWEDNDEDTWWSCGCGGWGSKWGGEWWDSSNSWENTWWDASLPSPWWSESWEAWADWSDWRESSWDLWEEWWAWDTWAWNASDDTWATASGNTSSWSSTEWGSSAWNTSSWSSSTWNTSSWSSSAWGSDSWWSSAWDSSDNGWWWDLKVEIPFGDWFQDIIADDSVITPNEANNSFTKFVQLMNTYLWIVMLVVFMLMLIYAGFTLFTSFGEDEKFKKWNKILLYVVVGLVVAVISYALINIVVNLF